jgi:hypothetical protein
MLGPTSCEGEPEPDQEIDGPATVLDFVPPKRVRRASRFARAVVLALLLVTVPQLEVRADEAAVTAPLPRSTAQAPQQWLQDVQEGEGLRRRLH